MEPPRRDDPRSDGFELPRSASADEALRWTASIAARRGAPADASDVLLGLLCHGRNAPIVDAARFVYERLEVVRPPDTLDAFDWISRNAGREASPPDAPERELHLGGFGPMARAVVDRAAALARTTSIDPKLSLRHLAGALLLGPGAEELARAAGLAGETGIAWRSLAREVLALVTERFPQEREAWLAWDAGAPAPASDAPSSEAPGSETPQDIGDRTAPPGLGVFLSQDDVEPHVWVALALARRLAGEQPIQPGHALLAIISLRMGRSPAFNRIRELVKLPDVSARHLDEIVDAAASGRLPLNARFAFDEALRAQIRYARAAAEGERRERKLWGRDLVTAVLLAGGDPLSRVLEQAGTSLERLRAEWYTFVVGARQGRTEQDWAAWWRSAGVPVPGTGAGAPGEAPKPATPDPEVEDALSWAAALANKTSRTMGPREVFVEMLRRAPLGLGEAEPALAWPAARTALGLPEFARPEPSTSRTLLPGGELDALLHETLPAGLSRVEALFLALFRPGPQGELPAADPVLSELRLDGDEVLEKLRTRLRARPAAAAAVREILDARRSALGGWNRPWAQTDRVSGPIAEDRDLLDARLPARRFAKLLAARHVDPPIALGLFGNWGSGKTFFMGLMRAQVEQLKRSESPDYARRPVQVEFNAWHYHDSNLWACLALRIFDELARELGGESPGAVEAVRKALHQRIHSSEDRREAASRRRDDALAEREKALRALEAKRELREKMRKTSVRLRLQAAWEVVRGDAQVAELRDAARRLGEQFGLPRAVEAAEDVERLRREVEATQARGLGLVAALGHRFDGLGPAAATVGVLVLAALAVVALGAGAEKLVAALQAQASAISAAIVQLGGLVSAGALWASRRVKDLDRALDAIGKVEASLAKQEVELARSPEEATLSGLIAELDRAIHRDGEEVAAAERDISEATAEIDRINRGGLVYDFLQERRTASSYLGQLGLVSTIRQDLEKLGTLLEDLRTHGSQPIDRIILYIDDLDRCHPDKVVEVLQAVHLLLAFDLFNVVVGVDARWLEHSLDQHYLGPGGGGPAGVEFSAQDYLEKIFQVPYALAPLDPIGFNKLVDGMIVTRSEWLKQRVAKGEPRRKGEPPRSAGPEEGGAPSQAAPPPGQARPGAGAEQGAAAPPAASGEAAETRTRGDGLPPAALPDPGVAPASFFEDQEEVFIQALHAFVDRPRLVKRLVNIYRLLRVRAHEEGEGARFLGPGGGDYRAALTLLAITVGHPRVARRLLRAVSREPEDGRWADLLERLATAKDPQHDGTWSDEERRELERLRDDLGPLSSLLPAAIEPYRRWAPRVGCFSFDWHRQDAPVRPAAARPSTGSGRAGVAGIAPRHV